MSTDTVRLDADRVVPAERPHTVTACFAVRAAADPGSLPRVLELFAKRGLVPSSVQARLTGDAVPALSVDLQVAGLEPALAEAVAEALRQIWVVERVLTAEVLPARVA
jgi:acetolactate synthase regulatory subunit